MRFLLLFTWFTIIFGRSHHSPRQAVHDSDTNEFPDFPDIGKVTATTATPQESEPIPIGKDKEENAFSFATDESKNYGHIDEGEARLEPEIPKPSFSEYPDNSPTTLAPYFEDRNSMTPSYRMRVFQPPANTPMYQNSNYNTRPIQSTGYSTYQRSFYSPNRPYRPAYYPPQRTQGYYQPQHYTYPGQVDTSDLVYLTANGPVPVNPALGPIILYGNAGQSPISTSYGGYSGASYGQQQPVYAGYNGYSQGYSANYGQNNGGYSPSYAQQSSYGQWSPYGTSYKIGGGATSYLG
ncbi:unnamed protein product, partial [Mesorhabditis belari]|uniref:Uncharacterized protein n=1 Tax=Mesorhabditis belari TaxID=2138241 RepID=A0AAF3EZU0_9BILA